MRGACRRCYQIYPHARRHVKKYINYATHLDTCRHVRADAGGEANTRRAAALQLEAPQSLGAWRLVVGESNVFHILCFTYSVWLKRQLTGVWRFAL